MKPGFDYIGVNVGFICHDGNGKILLHLRSDKCRDEHNTWDAGGGRVKFGERLEDAARREVIEEYGCTALRIDHVAQIELLREHNGRPTHWLANVFAVHVDPLEVRIMEPEKNLGIKWVTLDALPSPLHSAPAKILQDHLEKLHHIIHS